MKEILIPLNFTATPVLYDSKQSFSASDESSGVLTFTTTANVTGTVASLTIRNASDNANRQTILVERLDINSSPFSYIIVKPLPFGNYEGEIKLKKGTQIIASAVFLFGVNSSLSASVLPKLVEAYSLDALVENVETEVSNLKDAYNLTVSETVKGVNKTESSLQAQENVRYLNEHQRKANELERIANENARIAAEVERKDTFDTLVDSAVIEETVAQEVAEKYQEIVSLNAQEMVSFRQQLAESPYQREHHYYVGATQKYTTITAAYNKWVSDGRPKATIHILSGIYTEILVILNNVSNPYELSFVGENKKDVIWKSTNGYYKDSPLAYQGDGVIKGITFVADHSANPSYAYSGLSGNVWGDPVGGAYALHVDFAGAGTTLIQDCDLISYQNAGLGCGTRKDQTIALENVNIYSYTEVETGSAEQLGNGGFLYHTTNEEGATGQRLSLKNVKVFSENSDPFVYTHYSPDAVGATLEVITSNFASNAVTTRRNLFKLNEGPQPLLLTKNSYGNNVDSLNSIYSSDPIKALALTQPDGKCLQITNWNDVYYGFVMGDGTSLNAPVDGVWFIGYAFTYGYGSYTEQYAWQITSAHEKFKRSKTGGEWGAWERCYETLSEINTNVTNIISTGTDGNCLTVTNLDNATKNGYYLCDGSVGTANTPSSAWYGAHTISFNLSYKVQYAWEIATGAKYKRSYLNAVWGGWTAITEP
jgi:hypothetical protein